MAWTWHSTGATDSEARGTPWPRRASLGFLLLAGCGGSGKPVAEPGVTFFELLPHLRVEGFPGTNLPPEVASLLRGAAPFRTREIATTDWIYAGAPPDPFRSALPQGSRALYWQYLPPVALAPGGETPRPVRQGRALPAWDPARQDFPGEAIWWDPKEGCLLALAEAPPPGVRLECPVDAIAEIGDLEGGLLSRPEREAVPAERVARDTQRQVTIGSVHRRCLLLPAPASVRLDLRRVRAEELRVAFGVVGRGYRLVEGRLESSGEGSDGARFAVEVVEAGQAKRVWSRTVSPEEVGTGFLEASIDLRSFLDRPVSLRLVTEPGESGNAWFDYAAWGELRFAGPGGPRRSDRPHVILVDMDTLRADRVGSGKMPRLDAWAASNAVAFRDALSTSSWTVPATVSMVTGLAVHQHGAVRYPASLAPGARTLATYLRDAGYETHGLVEGAFLGPSVGLERGFDHYDWSGTAKQPEWEGVPEWVREHRQHGPFFLFLHTYIVHAPYPEAPDSEDARDARLGWLARRPIDYEGVIDPYNQGKLELGAREREHIARRYDDLVARADGLLGDLLEGLDRELGDDERLLIVTADHGEEIFEHERFGHGQSLYEELLRVPLVVRFPGQRGARSAAVREEPVSLLDLVPTVLEAAGVPVPEHLPGLPLLGPLPGRRARVAETHVHSAVRLGSLKLVLGEWNDVRWKHAPEELYDLKTDPGERRNLASEKPQTVRALRGVLDHFRTLSLPGKASSTAPGRIGGAGLEELRGLGYLGGPH